MSAQRARKLRIVEALRFADPIETVVAPHAGQRHASRPATCRNMRNRADRLSPVIVWPCPVTVKALTSHS